MHLVIMPHDMPTDIGNEKGEGEKWEGREKCASKKMIISPDWTFMERKMAMQERRYEEEERKMKQKLQMNQEDGEKRDHKSWRKSTTVEEKKYVRG
jgi:hypothetical protein